MHLSNRITTITGDGDDGWGIMYKARARQAAGLPVANLTIGEHDIRTAAPILQAMHAAAMAGHTGYADIPGIEGLRADVARRVQARTGVPTRPQNVLITPGGQAALFAAHIAALDPGDRALFLDPYYATYPGTIRSAGAIPVPVRADAERAFQPDADDITRLGKDARSLLINSPNNPTGVVYTDETMQGIAQVCRDQGLWLISDEVYETQVWQGAHLSPRTLPGMAAQTLVINSFSKSHAMTGSRIGWVIGPEEVLEHMGNLATNTTYGVAGFVQEAAAFALDQGADFEAKIAEPFRRRRDLVLRLLDGQNVVHAIPADGAMYIMLDIRTTGQSGEAFAEALLARHHVAVMPGESFGQAAAGHVRVALTVADARLEEAIRHLLALAAEMAG